MKKIYVFFPILTCCFVFALSAVSQKTLEKKYQAISLKPFNDSINHARYGYKDSIPPYKIYEDTQIVGIAENMLCLQNKDGGWGKNYDWAKINTPKELRQMKQMAKTVPPIEEGKVAKDKQSTLDNRNIYSQIEYLAQAYCQVPDERYKDSIQKALNWILSAQNKTSGGFCGSDVYAITYNDDVMTGVLRTLYQIYIDDALYGFLDKDVRLQCQKAFQKGIECILNTQIVVTQKDGSKVLTAWGQQHDFVTLQPIWARSFEPAAITASESCGILKLLMSIKDPSKEIKESIVAGVAWLSRDDIIIKGKKLVKVAAEAKVENSRYSDYEQVLVDDPLAPPLWARFYSLDTMQPIWCDRDKKICSSFNELSRERRNGYAYTGKWPKSVIEQYQKWQEDIH